MVVAGVTVSVWLVGRAIDFEYARAGTLMERGLPPVGAEGSHPSRLAGSGLRSVSVRVSEGTLTERVAPKGSAAERFTGAGRSPSLASRSLSVRVSELTYQGKPIRWWAARAVQNRRNSNKRGRTIRRLRLTLERAKTDVSPVVAIRLVFGAHAHEALRVSWCESRYDIGATNGQYLGLFQMGGFARSTYGHSYTALGQAQAAYRYFVASGRDWSPWQCKP